MTIEITNKAVSIRAKLFNLAKDRNIDFNSFLLRFFQERLLYRLSVSKYKNNFVLKGGLLLVVIDMPMSRPTIDVDFLARKIKNDILSIKKAFEDISSIEVDDGVIFDLESIKAERIIENADYEDIRVKIQVNLGQIKNQIQIDLGFGDIIIPEAKTAQFPSLLNMDAIKLKIYPLETVIAEKYEAMISLDIINSRMKDFYGIYTMLKGHAIDKNTLKEAVGKTFMNRNTKLIKNPVIFTSLFYENSEKQRQWIGFLKKNNLIFVPEKFKNIVLEIKKFCKVLFKKFWYFCFVRQKYGENAKVQVHIRLFCRLELSL